MKKFLIPFILFAVSFSLKAQAFKFEKETINYGEIAKGSNGQRVFIFTNVGDKPLIIKKVQSTCGCTVPEKPEKPIMPGEKGKIKVSYDTSNLGGFSKAITIISNAKEARKLIRIRGFVTKQAKSKK